MGRIRNMYPAVLILPFSENNHLYLVFEVFGFWILGFASTEMSLA